MNDAKQWARFQECFTEHDQLGLAIDISRMKFNDELISSLKPALDTAFAAMDELEKGAVANMDEDRMVGHYWLRNPSLAPAPELAREIQETVANVKQFSARVHSGEVKGQQGTFKNLLVVGIGGSALGPQFVAHALGSGDDKLTPYFFDNTDPDGMDRVLGKLRLELGRTLTIVISKSGGTKETRNGMLEAERAYSRAGLSFGAHAVGITSKGSELDQVAIKGGWIARFPMWDWVGGRTSVLSAVGLLPACLQGLDIDAMLAGAKACDNVTRVPRLKENPAAKMAVVWHIAGNGKGEKNLVVLPYKDRLELFSKYLQQLIMESLGKASDRNEKVVNQGLTVFGNKGSTDQHAYVQQLRDGRNDFFVTFIEVLKDRKGESMFVEPDVTSGDYLSGFLLGTRKALHDSGRESLTLTLKEVSPFSVGVLIALFERTVGLYASLINVNAYHQPGVEAGKKAAGQILALQLKVIAALRKSGKDGLTVAELGRVIGTSDLESIYKVCEHLAANDGRGIIKVAGRTGFEAKYQAG